MRSNVPLHARKKLPRRRAASLRWDGVTASRRADIRVAGARHPRGAGNGGIPEDINSEAPRRSPRP